MLKLDKVKKALKEGGISTLLYRGYRYTLIQLLPSKTIKYNEVEVKEGKN